MSRLIRFFATVIRTASITQATIPDRLIIAPTPETDLMSSSEDSDAFAACPKYPLNDTSQLVKFGDWTGPEDFSATVRMGWDKEAVFLRIDVVDDVPVPGSAPGSGDQITIISSHHTCGPVEPPAGRARLTAYDAVHLFPNPEKDSCAVEVESKAPGNFGTAETRLFRTLDGYSILVRLPSDGWDDAPAARRSMHGQIVFSDADDKANINAIAHQLVLFPFAPTGSNRATDKQNFGDIRFVERQWARATPTEVVYSGTKAPHLLKFGNLSKLDSEVKVFLKAKGQAAGEDGVNVFSKPLKAGETAQDVIIDIDLADVENGSYQLNSKVGYTHDLQSQSIQFVGSLSFYPELLERRVKKPARDLAILQRPRSELQTFRYLAGGGNVVWSAGVYDGSTLEFKERLRLKGAQSLEIPGATAADVPWALFGGGDNLDGTAEPLVLDFEENWGSSGEAFSPYVPGNKYRGNRLMRSKRLLLIGVVVDQASADAVPELTVTAGDRTLLKEKIICNPSSTPKRHSFVYRVWLKGTESKISIENTTEHGPRLGIDFMALLSGGPAETIPSRDSSITFSGAAETDLYNRQLATTLFLLRNYMIGSNGQVYTSLPGGRYGEASAIDYARLMNEMSHWGCTDEAKILSANAFRHLKFSRRSSGQYGAGHAALITAHYNAWRKGGMKADYLRRIWSPSILPAMATLNQETSNHPLGLVSDTGEFGGDGNGAATLPVNLATLAAVRSTIAMAKGSAYASSAPGWERYMRAFETSIKKNLIVSEGQFTVTANEVFEDAHGLGDQSVVSLLPVSTWVYGRYDDKKPVIYNNGTRLFDTPYLMAGLDFWTEQGGFTLEEAIEKPLQASYDYLSNASPLLGQSHWRRFRTVNYKSTQLDQWMIMSAMMLDNLPIAQEGLKTMINYSFDEDVALPSKDAHADAEVSPFTFEEKTNIADNTNADNLGATNDDLNIPVGTGALKLARMIAGIDDSNVKELKVTPRLPPDWTGVKAANWTVAHEFPRGRAAKIGYAYDRMGTNRYALKIKAPEPIKKVTVRFGPFDLSIRKVRTTAGGQTASLTVVKSGAHGWATQTFENVRNIEVTAQANAF
jgi:hypothetical protein